MRRIYTFIIVTSFLALAPFAEARKQHGDWEQNGSGSSANPSSGGYSYDVDLSKLPPCLDGRGNRIDPMNEQVLEWKKTTPNKFEARALIVGTLVGVFDSKPDHVHFDVFLGQAGSTAKENDLEVIYNQAFGRVNRNELKQGSTVIACGDYITATAQNGRYPPSPLGALIHWIHKSMNDKHPNGYLIIDGKLFGQQDAPPRGHGILETSGDLGDMFESFWAN